MTGPLVVLGILTIVGGWLNLPEIVTDLVPIGPVEVLGRFLDPVVGGATARITAGAVQVPATTEELLIGVAVLIAVIGIVFAVARLKPAKVPRKRDAVPETGFEGVVASKYYVGGRSIKSFSRPQRVSQLPLALCRPESSTSCSSVSAALAVRLDGITASDREHRQYAWAVVLEILVLLGVFTLR
jgi:NADH-quinone oxidoreductase subunit L